MNPLRRHWGLDPAVTFLNHGSFGACPLPVLEVQNAWRARLEREPVRFFVHDLEQEADRARAVLARFVGARPDDLAFVPNATSGVNAVLRSLELRPGDELLVTDHAYNACRTTLDYVARRSGAAVAVAQVPFPLAAAEAIAAAILQAVTPRTRLALIDHVTSPTALIFPVEQIVLQLQRRGILVLVDGAHAPGMLPLQVEALGADWYTGNCHKWLCAPKGAGFLWARPDRKADLHPINISHGYNSPRADRARFLLEFDWTGTADPTAYLCLPEALRFLHDCGDWMAHNRALASRGRDLLLRALRGAPPAPDALLGSMAALPLPPRPPDEPPGRYGEALQDRLVHEFGIQVPIVPWPQRGQRLVRISAQLYNEPADYERLAGALQHIFAAAAA